MLAAQVAAPGAARGAVPRCCFLRTPERPPPGGGMGGIPARVAHRRYHVAAGMHGANAEEEEGTPRLHPPRPHPKGDWIGLFLKTLVNDV